MHYKRFFSISSRRVHTSISKAAVDLDKCLKMIKIPISHYTHTSNSDLIFNISTMFTSKTLRYDSAYFQLVPAAGGGTQTPRARGRDPDTFGSYHTATSQPFRCRYLVSMRHCVYLSDNTWKLFRCYKSIL